VVTGRDALFLVFLIYLQAKSCYSNKENVAKPSILGACIPFGRFVKVKQQPLPRHVLLRFRSSRCLNKLATALIFLVFSTSVAKN
jgi:hypothetical protein